MSEVIFFDGEIVKEAMKKEVEKIWSDVMMSTNQVVFQTNEYGFGLIQIVPDPNIHQMLKSMLVVEGMLDKIIVSDDFDKLGHDQARKIINARECIRGMEAITTALRLNDEKAYDVAVADLKAQTPF